MTAGGHEEGFGDAGRGGRCRVRRGDEEILAAPAGRVRVAGEHTAGDWAGLMEGALRSGERAAREVLATTLCC